MYNLICKEILKMELPDLNRGIWDLILKYKNSEFDLCKYGFKEYYTVLQHLELMKIINILVLNMKYIKDVVLQIALLLRK